MPGIQCHRVGAFKSRLAYNVTVWALFKNHDYNVTVWALFKNHDSHTMSPCGRFFQKSRLPYNVTVWALFSYDVTVWALFSKITT